jgi:hypothetical protein
MKKEKSQNPFDCQASPSLSADRQAQGDNRGQPNFFETFIIYTFHDKPAVVFHDGRDGQSQLEPSRAA